MAVPVRVWVTGVNQAETLISVELGKIQTKAVERLIGGAAFVAELAATNLAEHNYTGRAASAVRADFIERKAAPGFSLPHPLLFSVQVGIPHNRVPEFFVGATFERGWKSKNGKQPPVEPLAMWAIARGLADTPSQAKRVGFIIAQNIAKRGYSFGTDKWLTNAWEMAEPMLGPLIGTGFTWRKK